MEVIKTNSYKSSIFTIQNKELMEYRIEKDTIGEVKVPINVYWGLKQNVHVQTLKLVILLPCQWK